MLFFPTTAIGHVHIHRHFSRPIVYYPNTTSTRQILVGGDIETNPGPPSKAAVCANCERSIRRDHRRSSCSTCQEPLHLKCSGLPLHLIQKHDLPVPATMCSLCVARLLPFGDTSLTSNSNSVNDTDSNLSVNPKRAGGGGGIRPPLRHFLLYLCRLLFFRAETS